MVTIYVISSIIERPIHFLEKVLDVTLTWTTWPDEFCHDNHLVVKENYVYANVNQVVSIMATISAWQPSLHGNHLVMATISLSRSRYSKGQKE